MKHNLHFHGLLFLLLIFSLSLFSTTSSGRLLLPKQGDEGEEVNLNGLLQKSPILELDDKEAVQVMGVEECQSGDDEEECLKRRMIAEAHLDYIYTQHHKP